MNAFLEASFPPCPLKHFEKFSHVELEAVESRMNQFIIPHKLSARTGPPRGQFHYGAVDLGAAHLGSVFYDFDGGPLHVDCPTMDADYRFQVTLRGAGSVSGRRDKQCFGPTGFVIIHPNQAFHETFDSRCHHILLTVKRESLEQAFFELTGRTVRERLRFYSSVVDVHDVGRALVRHIALICQSLHGDKLTSSDSPVPRELIDTLLVLILQSLDHNHIDDLQRAPKRLAASSVRRVEDYIAAHARFDVSMHDLVDVSGCSARSLHYGFRARRGIGPMRYLRNYRLALSRTDLLAAHVHGRSVTEIALDCGFTHMSKFTAAYKTRYGEAPSQTRGRTLRGQ